MVAATALTISTGPLRSPSSSRSGSPALRKRLSSFHALSSFRLEEEKPRPPVADHVVLLLQEWLTIIKFPATLRCLLDEYSRELKREPPAMDKWFEMTQQLDLHAFHAHDPTANTALLERIVEQPFARARHRKELTKQTAPVLVSSKRPLTASTLKFAIKRCLPMGPATTHSKSTSALPGSPASRPKSAAIVPTPSKSTSDLLLLTDKALTKLTPLDESSSVVKINNQSSPKRESATSQLRRGSSRPISAAPGSLTPYQDKQPGSVRKQSASSASPKAFSGARASVCSQASLTTTVGQQRSSRSLTLKSSSSSQLIVTPKETSRLSETKETNNKGDQRSEEDAEATAPQAEPEFQPVMDLEDMNEERLTEHFGAFSKGTIKKLRRVLAKSSAHSQDLQRTRKAMEKIKLRAQQQHDRSAFAAQQTDLLSSTMDSLTKEPCSLCRYVFLKKNLTTKVSYKSICDLRASWVAKKREQLKANGSGPEAEDSEATKRRLDPDEELSDAQAQAQPLESAQQISHLYNEVPVCVFCAQLALDFSSYRPSSAEQKQRKEEKRRLALEHNKQREAQHLRDKLKCDPLDFHSYELNSEDEDGESETEEVLEVDADGRVSVVRRRRRRRRTVLRTPAQTGFVSKRLHYENLRSQSVHALNRKEWEVISQQQQQPTG